MLAVTTTHNSRALNIIALLLIVGVSVVAGVVYFSLSGTNPKVPSVPVMQPSPPPEPTPENTKQPPTLVSIPAIKRSLPIQAAQVRDNQWDMFDKSVAWLSTSAVPGEGNVILYAHNRKSLWADLSKLKPGDSVTVEQNLNVFTYEVTESRAVTPKDIDAILSTDNQLTMYTCEGSFDQKRRVVYAKLLQAPNN